MHVYNMVRCGGAKCACVPGAHAEAHAAQDARAFVRALAGAGSPAVDADGTTVPVPPQGFDHIVMNLPASAIQFLGAAGLRRGALTAAPPAETPASDAFAGAFCAAHWEGRRLPLVHCYSFLRGGETVDDVRKARRAPCVVGVTVLTRRVCA